MEIKKFVELDEMQIDYLASLHFSHWSKFNPQLQIKQIKHKFSKTYCSNTLPYGIALLDNNAIVGFCVLKLENLKKHKEFSPWISDVFILKKERNKGYGRVLIMYAEKLLKKRVSIKFLCGPIKHLLFMKN